jgi:putative transposase
MDFIVDGLATGRMVRILSVVDAYTRECLALEADTSLGSGRVPRVLERLIGERGRPENVRSDNGPEFTSRRMIGWAEDWKVGLVHIQPGRPMQNGHVESFHGRLRDECLNASWFRTLNDVRCTLATWREEYNCERPHSSWTIARHRSSSSPSKKAGPWPGFLRQPQPPTQLRNSSYEWLIYSESPVRAQTAASLPQSPHRAWQYRRTRLNPAIRFISFT